MKVSPTRAFCAAAIGLSMLVTTVPASPASADTQSVQGAAYKYLKRFMNRYNGAGFSEVASIGSPTTYRGALLSVKTEIDPSLTSVAAYDPNTKTIKFSKDPRKIPSADGLAMGETVWHELSHAIEDAHGDFGVSDSEGYAERNVDYMTAIARNALPVLERMEAKADDGTAGDKLAPYWAKFLERVQKAGTLPSTSANPVDPAILQSWFGFNVNPETIKALYASGKALPGKAGKALSEAVSGKPSGAETILLRVDSISAVTNGPTVPTTFTLPTPAYITSIFTYHYFNHGTGPGTIGLRSADGKTYGPWKARGTDGQGGVANANWFASPKTVIPAGTYTVVDSNPGTWSWAPDTNGQGIAIVKGIVM